jgi:hypothetical protein
LQLSDCGVEYWCFDGVHPAWSDFSASGGLPHGGNRYQNADVPAVFNKRTVDVVIQSPDTYTASKPKKRLNNRPRFLHGCTNNL